MRVCVVLYQNLRLNTCKVSQEGYKALAEAQTFCEKRLGMDVNPENPAIYVEGTGDKFIYGNSVTKEKYTVVEVTV